MQVAGLQRPRGATSQHREDRVEFQHHDMPAGSPGAESPLEGLVIRLQKGDSAALEELIRATQKLGYRLAYGLLQDRQLAEDALQDVYLTIYRSISQLREPKAFKGWFCRILSNQCHKIRKKKPTDFLEDMTVRQQPQQESHSQEVETRLEVRQAFSQLSESDREVLAMREVLDLSYDEIAETLKVPLSTIKTRLFKARQRLLAFFKREGGSAALNSHLSDKQGGRS